MNRQWWTKDRSAGREEQRHQVRRGREVSKGVGGDGGGDGRCVCQRGGAQRLV